MGRGTTIVQVAFSDHESILIGISPNIYIYMHSPHMEASMGTWWEHVENRLGTNHMEHIGNMFLFFWVFWGLCWKCGRKGLANKGCVTLWPCHFTLKNILRRRKIMETQIFHHANL
jgi:hypothetical protein